MKFLKNPLTLLIIGGICAGFVNGLLGAGGGILVVLGLRALYGKKKEGTHAVFASAIAVMLPLSAFSAWQYAQKGGLPPFSFLGLALPAALGGMAGALLLKKISPKLLT